MEVRPPNCPAAATIPEVPRTSPPPPPVAADEEVVVAAAAPFFDFFFLPVAVADDADGKGNAVVGVVAVAEVNPEAAVFARLLEEAAAAALFRDFFLDEDDCCADESEGEMESSMYSSSSSSSPKTTGVFVFRFVFLLLVVVVVVVPSLSLSPVRSKSVSAGLFRLEGGVGGGRLVRGPILPVEDLVVVCGGVSFLLLLIVVELTLSCEPPMMSPIPSS